MALPQAAIALVGYGEDVRGKLAQVAPAVLLHGGALVQASDGLVGVHRRDDGADVGLQAEGKDGTALPGQQGQARTGTLPARHSAQRAGAIQRNDGFARPQHPLSTLSLHPKVDNLDTAQMHGAGSEPIFRKRLTAN